MPQHNADGDDATTPSASAQPIEEQLPLTVDERPADRLPDPLDQLRDRIAAGELGAAHNTLRGLVVREPRNVRARALLAQLLEKRGDLEGAVSELTQALDVVPDDIGLLCARAALHTARARYDQAEVDLRRAARLDESNAEVQVQLGVLFCKRARWREAIEPLRAAVDRDPRRATALYHLGDAYNHIDDLPAALSAYEAAATIDPKNSRALKGLGVVLDRLGRPVEAAAAYQRAREAQRR